MEVRQYLDFANPWCVEVDGFDNEWYILYLGEQTDELTDKLLLELKEKIRGKTYLIKANDWDLKKIKELYHQRDDVYLYPSVKGDIIPRLLNGKIISSRVIIIYDNTTYVVNDRYTPVLLPPGGTAVLEDRSSLNVALRGVKEETGLDLSKEKLIKKGFIKFKTDIMRLTNVNDTCYIYFVELNKEPKIVIDNKEIISFEKFKVPIIPDGVKLYDFCKETLPRNNNKYMSGLWWYLILGFVNKVKILVPDILKKKFGPNTPVEIFL
jgi:hypothetical protein